MKKDKSIPTVNLDPLSYVAIPLKILSKDKQSLGTCTGFLYELNNEYFLITNWHNFTAKNPQTKKMITKEYVLPWKVEIPFQTQKKPFIKWKRYIFDILDEDTNPLWLVHPKQKELIDVVALRLVIPKDTIPRPINKCKFEKFSPMIADDVFILGFPYDFKGGGNFPTWKHGTIATEPDINMFSLPQILVDTATREGMSGSPVILRRTGIHGLVDNKPIDTTVIGEVQNFIGIYSGRYHGNNEKDAQFGIIWKHEVIEEILNGDTIDSIQCC